ncbi:pyridoxine 5'-phosphate synthase [Akkermansiaceae bacterium]|nr:pyridoxine 5'-phosphate synthase [Akkermansiaceae bacterium]
MGLLLGVNIDHVATLRQARYALNPNAFAAEPSPTQGALDAIAGGADSITIHVRGDRRHMQTEDAFEVKKAITVPLNLEMGNSEEMLKLALELQPTFVCMVPETREEVTTEGGLDVHGLYDSVAPTVKTLQEAGIKVSMFIDPDIRQVEASAQMNADMIELHTGCFANTDIPEEIEAELERLKLAAIKGHELGIQVNAGHGINYQNIGKLHTIPHLKELNIGHTIVARSVRVGLQTAVAEIREKMNLFPY